MSAPTLLAVERAAMAAWPALETVDAAGWVLRFADGYTRRESCAAALDRGCGIGAGIAWSRAVDLAPYDTGSAARRSNPSLA